MWAEILGAILLGAQFEGPYGSLGLRIWLGCGSGNPRRF